MRKHAVILGTSVALFGAIALYLLNLGDSRTPDVRSGVIAGTASTNGANPGAPADAGRPAAASAPAAATPASSPPRVFTGTVIYVGEGAQSQAEFDRQELSDFGNPAKRKRMFEDSKTTLRGKWRGLGKYLGVGADAEGQIIDMLANEELRRREQSLRCQVDNVCEPGETTPVMREKRLRAVGALVGADNARRFDEFESTLLERAGVTTLRGRFDDAIRLTDDQVERLVASLANYRQRAIGELRAGNSGYYESNDGVFTIAVSNGGAGLDAQRAEAREYTRHLREEAAQILEEPQLAIFDAALAESLADFERQLEDRAARSR